MKVRTSNNPFRTLACLFLSAALFMNNACTTAAAGNPSAVADTTSATARVLSGNIRKGEQVTVTQKDGTAHSLKITRIDDNGIHGTDSAGTAVTVPLNKFHSLAANSVRTRPKTDRGHHDGSGGVDAGKVAAGSAGVAALLVLAGYSIAKGAGAALGSMAF